jgi:hypothetical protein
MIDTGSFGRPRELASTGALSADAEAEACMGPKESMAFSE